MKKELETVDGIQYSMYSISNSDVSISVTDYGATLCNFVYKGTDIVQGFENVSGYINEVKYMNATIGRVCNRIGNGTFTLNAKTYHVPVNNGPNCLHGGINGFDTKLWECQESEHQLVFTYTSVDGEEGFPGNVTVKVTYELLDDGLAYSYEATSDQDTLVSICNHAFFNLNGPTSTTILNDYLQVNATKIACVDANGLTQEETLTVKDTPFDFTTRKLIGQDITSNHPQITNAKGYDHHFIIDGDGLRHFGTYDNNRVAMDIYSDLPGMHIYSGNYLEGIAHGKQENTYPCRSSICFETQYYPNAINLTEPIKPILKANQTMKHTTQFRLKEINNEN